MATYAMHCWHCGCLNDCEVFVDILEDVEVGGDGPRHYEEPCADCGKTLTPAGWVKHAPAEAWGWATESINQPPDLKRMKAWNVPETAEKRAWRERIHAEENAALN